MSYEKYRNPDKRCSYPWSDDAMGYCWTYAGKVDEIEEINMDYNCKGCEYFIKEASDGK